MFTLNLYRFPAIGKEAELRGVLEETAQLDQGLGTRSTLAQRLFNPDGPAFVSVLSLPSLEALMAFRQQLNGDSRWIALRDKIATLIRKPAGTQLLHLIVAPAQAQDAEARYVRRTHLFPALGKEVEARTILEEYVRTRHAEGGTTVRLLREIFSASGYNLRIVTTFRDIAEVEAATISPPASTLQAVARIHGISRAQLTQDLLEVIVPFQS